MIDKELLDKLHNNHVVEKRGLIWWQLGYEGRNIISEEELHRGLEKHIWTVRTEKGMRQKEVSLWKSSNIPIVIRKINFGPVELDCLISVKPWEERDQRAYERSKFPPSIYNEPHIRGLVAEIGERHVFWFPFKFSRRTEYYSTRVIEIDGLNIILQAIEPGRFYKNLIDVWDKGRRLNKKARVFNCTRVEAVPYFEFNANQEHLSVYPVKLLEGKLDFPIFYAGGEGKAEILGMGYIFLGEGAESIPEVYYFDIPEKRFERVKKTFQEKLGLEATLKEDLFEVKRERREPVDIEYMENPRYIPSVQVPSDEDIEF